MIRRTVHYSLVITVLNALRWRRSVRRHMFAVRRLYAMLHVSWFRVQLVFTHNNDLITIGDLWTITRSLLLLFTIGLRLCYEREWMTYLERGSDHQLNSVKVFIKGFDWTIIITTQSSSTVLLCCYCCGCCCCCCCCCCCGCCFCCLSQTFNLLGLLATSKIMANEYIYDFILTV